MKHIGKTNEKEAIVILTTEDLKDLMAATDAASILYNRDLKENPEDRGAMIMRKMMNNWWVKLYELKETLK